MIVVIGAAEFAVKIKMKPLKEEEEWAPSQNTDSFDYSTLNVPAKQAEGDDIAMKAAGCGLNIAAHLAEMGQETAFVSVVGNDPAGHALLAHMKQQGIHAESVKVLEGCDTAVGVELLNILNDPQFAYANHGIYGKATPETAAQWDGLLKEAEIIVMDGALPQETIEFIAEKYGGKDAAAIFFDPGSFAGTHKITNVMEKIHCIMPGRMEAEAMARRSILSEDQLMEAGNYFTENGIAKIVITMKGGGLYYKEGLQEGILRPDRVLSFVDTTGAGDVVSAALVDAYARGKSMEESALLAMDRAAAFLADREDKREL